MKQTLIAVCLTGIVGFVILFRLGSPPLFDPDEPRYAQSAREMNERGSLLIPYFNNQPRLNKPVLYYWVIAGIYRLFGVSEFSARLASAGAALVLFVTTFIFVCHVCGLRAAAFTGLILGSMPLFLVPARLVMPDMLFSLWMILALYCFYLGWDADSYGRRQKWFFGFYVFQVIAAWTKGPVGILVPLAVAVLCLVRSRDWVTLRSLRLHWAIPAVLAASLPWYLYIFLTVDRHGMLTLAGQETAGRIFGISRDYEPLYYYLPALAGGLFPWILVLPWAWYQRRRMQPHRLRMLCEMCFLFVLVFFSLCAAKKYQYIIMLASVCAVWLGSILGDVYAVRTRERALGLIGGICAGLCGVLVAGFEGVAWISRHELSLLPGSLLLFGVMVIAFGAALIGAVRGFPGTAIASLSATTLVGLVVFVLYGAPWVGERRSLRECIREHDALFQKTSAVYCASKVFNSLVFYSPRPVYLNMDEEEILARLRSAEPCMGIISRRRARKLRAELAPFFFTEKYDRMIFTNINTSHPP
ncbi:MAG: glycosyltransferase family 39 protein [Desulfobacterota bacterium]|nr:glycosyltransferase family 39 protein [Thermodesulfobacteriota bacterium]